jgi:long-chain fatty acid transport protein
MAASVQDAGTAFWNPAGLPLLADGLEVAAAVHRIETSFDFRSQGGPPSGSTYEALGDGGDAGGGNTVPAVYAAWKVNPRLGIGIAIDAPFGLKTEWNAPWSGMFAGVLSDVKTMNFNPVAGYRIGSHWLIGAGVSYQRMEATLSNGVTPLVPAAVGTVEGDDWSYGWNAGVLFDSGRGTRVGVTYRSKIDYDIQGDLTFNSPTLAPLQSNVKASISLPHTIALAVSQNAGSRVRLLADVTWTGWDSIQSLTIVATNGARAGQTVASTPLNFKDSWRAGLGTEYEISGRWLLRFGVAYDSSPVQDAFRTPRLPDEDRKWLAAGARFRPNEAWSFDAGYAHLWVESASSELSPVGAVPGALRGTYKSASDVFGVQAAVRF